QASPLESANPLLTRRAADSWPPPISRGLRGALRVRPPRLPLAVGPRRPSPGAPSPLLASGARRPAARRLGLRQRHGFARYGCGVDQADSTGPTAAVG